MKTNRIISICLIIMILSGCSSQTPSAVSETVDVSSAVSVDTYMPEQTSADIPKTSEVIVDITSAELSPPEKYTPSDEEKLQIQDLLTRSKKFFFEYIDCKEICKHKNENSSVTTQEIIHNGMHEGQTESKTWYEVADGEVMSFNDLNEKMDQIFTEKMIESLGDILGNSYHEENGRLYISDGAGSDGGVLETDTVYINSVGEMDENTFVLYMTAFGAGENWDLDFDIKDDFTVILKKTDRGLKIDECDAAAYQYIEWCYNSNDDMFEINSKDNNVEESEFTIPTASPDKVQLLIDNVELPSIIITDNSSYDEILQAGKTAAEFFSEATEMYFGYGIDYNWKLSQNNDDMLSIDKMKPYQTSGTYWKSLGLYTETRESYVPMNGNESKQFLIDYLRLTEKGYEELCENSPSTYIIKDDVFYVSSGDGGQAGWSFSQIIDYTVSENELGEKVVTYNCERVGDAEEWGYDEDLIQPFNFRLAFEDNTWKLDGVSYGEGFFELKWLLN